MAKTTQQLSSNQNKSTEILLSTKRIVSGFGLAVILLAVLSLASQSIRFLTDYDKAFGLIPLVYMGKMLSVPTIFMVLEYFIAFLVLLIISIRKFNSNDQFRWQWVGLAVIFLYLSFDKGTALHAYVFMLIRDWMQTFVPLFPHHRWVFNLNLAGILFALFYLKFFKALPKRTILRMSISVAIFYLGFLVIERFTDDFKVIYTAESLIYSISITVGKTLEMSGLVVGISTLLDYLKLTVPDLSIDIQRN